jgi:DNA segregation ATPase FtsK/SpoIIIE, S-DNA-T family
MLLLATQRPDARSLPTGVSANVGTRFCLRVMGQLENDMILGTSAYKNGVRATMFTARDKGVGYLVGGPDPDPRSPACSTSITPPPSG